MTGLEVILAVLWSKLHLVITAPFIAGQSSYQLREIKGLETVLSVSFQKARSPLSTQGCGMRGRLLNAIIRHDCNSTWEGCCGPVWQPGVCKEQDAAGSGVGGVRGGSESKEGNEASRFYLADIMFVSTIEHFRVYMHVCICLGVHICTRVCICIDQKTNLRCLSPFQKGSLISWSLPSKLGQLARKLQGSSCLPLSHMDFKPSPTDTALLNQGSGDGI